MTKVPDISKIAETMGVEVPDNLQPIQGLELIRLKKSLEIPCYHCNKLLSKQRVKIEHDGIILSICLCNSCVWLPNIILVEKTLAKQVSFH